MNRQGAVLVTRPADRSIALTEALGRMGYIIFSNPLLAIVPTNAALPDPALYQGIVFTSASAIPFCPVVDLPVFTVGEATAAAARAAGFQRVTCGGFDVASLDQYLSQEAEMKNHTLLYPSGTDITREFSQSAPGAGPEITRVAVYNTIPQPLQKTIIQHLYAGDIAWIVLFSRRTAEVLCDEMTRLDYFDWVGQTGVACLAHPVAEPIQAFQWRTVGIAARPEQDALLSCLAA